MEPEPYDMQFDLCTAELCSKKMSGDRARLVQSGESKFSRTTLTKDLSTVCMDVLRTKLHHVHLNS